MTTRPRLIFIVGCQRSGTTLMGQVLGAHPQAMLADETDGIYEWVNAVFESGGASNRQIIELHEKARAKYVKSDEHFVLPSNNMVLQAPNLTLCHNQISRYFPDARVVYMLRDVRAVVASMQQLNQIPFVQNQIRLFRQAGFIERDFPGEWRQLTNEATTMVVKMALVAKIKMSLVSNFEGVGIPVLCVKYEDLVAKAKFTVANVLRHTSLSFDQKCLAHDQALHGTGPGGTVRARPIDQSSYSKWKEQLLPESLDSIWAAVGDFYEELGYQRYTASSCKK